MTKQPVGIPHRNPLDYTGPNKNIVPIQGFSRRPLPTDKKYNLGQTVILGKNPSTGLAGELWYLARFETNGDADWVQFTTGGTGINFLESDAGPPPVGPDINETVNVLGGTGITTSGQDPSTTLTIAVDGNVVTTQYDADAGNAVPAAGILNVVGSTGLDTSAAGNTLTVNLDGNVVTTQYDADVGSAVPVAGILNIVGSAGLDTSAAANTLTVNLDGNVVTTQYDADAGSAVPSAGILNIIGGNGTVTSAAGNTVIAEMQSPFAGNFSFESNTGGVVETLTVQNTVDAASSGALMEVIVAGAASSAHPVVKVTSTAQRAAGMFIDTAFDVVRFQRSISGSTTLSEEFLQVDGADGTARVLFNGPGGVAVTANDPAGLRTLLHVINSNVAANSDVEVLLQTADPAAGGGSQSIRWGSAGQVQFSLGQGKDATPTTQPLEFKEGGFAAAGLAFLQIHPGAEGNITCNRTGAFKVQVGTTAERPVTPTIGMMRFNTTTGRFEGYDGAWGNL